MSALFVRPAWGCFYYGNYFGRDYLQNGFTPWTTYRPAGMSYDPLFNFYRWMNRANRRWEQDLRALYASRFAGRAPLPPLTPDQQDQLIAKVNNGRFRLTTVANVQMVVPLSGWQGPAFKVAVLSGAQMAQEQKAVKLFRAVARKRQEFLTKLAQDPGPTRPTDRVRVARIALPKAVAAVKSGKAVRPPGLPTMPRAVVKALPRQKPVKAVVLSETGTKKGTGRTPKTGDKGNRSGSRDKSSGTKTTKPPDSRRDKRNVGDRKDKSGTGRKPPDWKKKPPVTGGNPPAWKKKPPPTGGNPGQRDKSSGRKPPKPADPKKDKPKPGKP
jgi:hypothetical protein